MTAEQPTRPHTPVDEIADSYVEHYAALDPLLATELGVGGHDAEMTDLSPAGHAARADLSRDTLRRLDGVDPVDEEDVTTLEAKSYLLGTDLELHAAGETQASLNNIASPVQGLRDVFDLMATDTPDDWAAIAARLVELPGAVAGYVESLREAAGHGRVAAARQVAEAIRQAAEQAATRIGVERERVPRDDPRDGDDRDRHEAMHDHRQRMLRPDHAGVEEREPRRHQQDERRADDDPRRVSGVDRWGRGQEVHRPVSLAWRPIGPPPWLCRGRA